MEAIPNLRYLNLWDVPFTVEPQMLYNMPSLELLGLNVESDHPSPDMIRTIRKNLSGQVQFIDPDI